MYQQLQNTISARSKLRTRVSLTQHKLARFNRAFQRLHPPSFQSSCYAQSLPHVAGNPHVATFRGTTLKYSEIAFDFELLFRIARNSCSSYHLTTKFSQQL